MNKRRELYYERAARLERERLATLSREQLMEEIEVQNGDWVDRVLLVQARQRGISLAQARREMFQRCIAELG